MIRSIYFGFIVVLMLVAGRCLAHQQKQAYTTVLFNDRSGFVEISHRFYIHDAEHIMTQLFAVNDGIVESKQTQKQFADYIEKAFLISSEDKTPFILQHVGYEVEGKYFWVYQQMLIPVRVGKLYLKMNALQEIWPRHINQVNVERLGVTHSARFSSGDGWKLVPIPVKP